VRESGCEHERAGEHAGSDHALDRAVGPQELLGGHRVAAVTRCRDEREGDADGVDAARALGEEQQRASGYRRRRRREPSDRQRLGLEPVRAEAGCDRGRAEGDERGQAGAGAIDGCEERCLEDAGRDGRYGEPGPVAPAQPRAWPRALRQGHGCEGEPPDEQACGSDRRGVRAGARERLGGTARSPQARGGEHRKNGELR
jgi:hypothetical protein